jgi:hypothetical protein
MCPCAGISLILTVFFIKKISLKRDDDAAKKAEAKAWVESKKVKHRKGGKDGAAHTMEKDVEEAGRGVEQAAGVPPSREEVEDQDVIGAR